MSLTIQTPIIQEPRLGPTIPGSSVICTGLRYLGGAHTADRPRLSSKFKVDFSVSVSCTIVHPERREGPTLHFCIHIHHDHKLIFSWIPSFSEWSTYVVMYHGLCSTRFESTSSASSRVVVVSIHRIFRREKKFCTWTT